MKIISVKCATHSIYVRRGVFPGGVSWICSRGCGWLYEWLEHVPGCHTIQILNHLAQKLIISRAWSYSWLAGGFVGPHPICRWYSCGYENRIVITRGNGDIQKFNCRSYFSWAICFWLSKVQSFLYVYFQLKDPTCQWVIYQLVISRAEVLHGCLCCLW